MECIELPMGNGSPPPVIVPCPSVPVPAAVCVCPSPPAPCHSTVSQLFVALTAPIASVARGDVADNGGDARPVALSPASITVGTTAGAAAGADSARSARGAGAGAALEGPPAFAIGDRVFVSGSRVLEVVVGIVGGAKQVSYPLVVVCVGRCACGVSALSQPASYAVPAVSQQEQRLLRGVGSSVSLGSSLLCSGLLLLLSSLLLLLLAADGTTGRAHSARRGHAELTTQSERQLGSARHRGYHRSGCVPSSLCGSAGCLRVCAYSFTLRRPVCGVTHSLAQRSVRIRGCKRWWAFSSWS